MVLKPMQLPLKTGIGCLYKYDVEYNFYTFSAYWDHILIEKYQSAITVLKIEPLENSKLKLSIKLFARNQ